MYKRIAITGSSGLIGSAVADHFRKLGYEITRIVHKDHYIKTHDKVIYWNIPLEKIDLVGLERQDAVIHLAGDNIANKRWTPKFKQSISDSRIQGTTFLVRTLAKLQFPPSVLISASAVGYYGHVDPGHQADESALKGQGFLADLCERWEKVAKVAQGSGIRVITARMGMVLSKDGGALKKMLPVFKVGLGGKLGSGKQMMSWIALDEIPSIIEFLINSTLSSGPVNFVAPSPVSNREFTKTLGKVLKRLTILPVPAFMIKLLFGEMGQELLLNGARVIPRRLNENRYPFKYPNLEGALKLYLG